MRSTATEPLTRDRIDQLWVQPESIAARDLFWGPGGEANAPVPKDSYRVTDFDTTGFSRGYDVVGSDGRPWKVKLGPEAQSELVASRVLWAIGYHQPAVYAINDWKLSDGTNGGSIARFRLRHGYRAEGEWSWQRNPYVGTREFNGLLVSQLVLNNWDLKSSNNRVYGIDASEMYPRTRLVVQDLGASLGRTRWPVGNRNDPASFERQRLVKKVEAERVVFDYGGRHRELFRNIPPADVVWVCRLLAQLTDQQWQDVFRAARYSEAQAARFIAKLQSKIKEGLVLAASSGTSH